MIQGNNPPLHFEGMSEYAQAAETPLPKHPPDVTSRDELLEFLGFPPAEGRPGVFLIAAESLARLLDQPRHVAVVGRRKKHESPRTQQPVELARGGYRVGDMFEDVDAEHRVKGCAGKRQRHAVRENHAEPSAAGHEVRAEIIAPALGYHVAGETAAATHIEHTAALEVDPEKLEHLEHHLSMNAVDTPERRTHHVWVSLVVFLEILAHGTRLPSYPLAAYTAQQNSSGDPRVAGVSRLPWNMPGGHAS